MSSAPNNTQTRRMSSIRRSLQNGWLGRQLGRILLSSLMILILFLTAFTVIRERDALGRFSIHTERNITAERDTSGKIHELWYEAKDKDGDVLRVALRQELRVFFLAGAVLFSLRILWLFIASFPAQKRRTGKILAPLSELSLKADQLSRMEFGEDKYRLIEDAISHLDTTEDAQLSLRDSELVGIEAAINDLLHRVRESNRQQARFVNDASHELRTPIAVIGGYADMLERWGKNDENVLNESIAAIQTETARMKHLVEQLLFLARGDSGRTQLQPEPTSPAALMREAYEESVMIDEKHIYRLKEEAPEAVIQADPGLLKQAVRILIDNAAKYTREGDEILLSSGRQDGRVYLQVQDCGIGMAEADVEHMFERFYRADEARSIEGTGLGLSIAKELLTYMGEDITVESEYGHGTKFTFTLKKAEAANTWE